MTNKIELPKEQEKSLKKQGYTQKGIQYLKKLLNTDEEVSRSANFKAGYILLFSATCFIINFILKLKGVYIDFLSNIAFFSCLFLFPIYNFIILSSTIEFDNENPVLNKSNAVVLAGFYKTVPVKRFLSLSIVFIVILSIVGMGHWFLAILFITFFMLSFKPSVVEGRKFKNLINAEGEKLK
jgi:hypothetical protein